MNKNKIVEAVREIESRLKYIKDEINLVDDEVKISPNPKIKKIASKSREKDGPTKPIADLIKGDFFNSSKSCVEVVREFRKRAFNYDTESVRISLMRFVRKEVLEREGDGTSKNPWKYKKK